MKNQDSKKDIEVILKNPKVAFRMGIIDAHEHSKEDAFARYEGESGSIGGLLAGYDIMLRNINEDLSIHEIDKIRNGFFKYAHFGNSVAVKVDINKMPDETNYTMDQLRTTGIGGSTNEDRARIEIEATELRKKTFNRYRAGNSAAGLPYEVTKSKLYGAGKEAIKYTNALILDYNLKRDKNNKRLQLLDILYTVKNLQRVHAYRDFNGRTFCAVVLNRELIKNGYSPTLMDDPHVIKYKSDKEVYDAILQGQKNFIRLRETGLAHEGDITNERILDYLMRKEDVNSEICYSDDGQGVVHEDQYNTHGAALAKFHMYTNNVYNNIQPNEGLSYTSYKKNGPGYYDIPPSISNYFMVKERLMREEVLKQSKDVAKMYGVNIHECSAMKTIEPYNTTVRNKRIV